MTAAGQLGGHGPLPRSLANLKREILEKKWVEAHHWTVVWTSKTKYCMPNSPKPDGMVADSTKRLASRFYQPNRGARPHRSVPALGEGSLHRSMLVVSVPLPNKRPPLQGLPAMEDAADGCVGGGVEGDQEWEEQVDGSGPAGR